MEFKKLLLATAIVGAFGLAGCNDEDTSVVVEGDTTTNPPPSEPDDGGDGSAVSSCPEWASALPQQAGVDVCRLPSTIMEDRTLTADTVWFMDGRVTVGNGNLEMSATEGMLANDTPVANVVLTIEPGTEIKGDSGTFANLLITRGSMIMAEGTAEAPIIFSSDDSDYTGSGEWGGLIIQGYGSHNECSDPAVACNVDSEGEAGFAGGYSPDDNSGVLSYVIVTEGGYEFAVGNEINGVSLVGVGAGTTMDHIQVNDNADDGIEFFGGEVNVSHLVLTNNLDDSVDWDEGFQGNLQYVLVKQNPDDGDNGVEADTFGTDAFLSMPVVANATFIASAPNDTIMTLKEGTGGYFINTVMAADNVSIATCVKIDGAEVEQNIVDGTLAFVNTIADCPSFGNDTIAANGTTFQVPAELTASLASGAAEAQLDSPIDWAELQATYSMAPIDMEFLEPTDFIGAVNPDGSDNWYEGWILEGTL
jgi:hypothetical protein